MKNISFAFFVLGLTLTSTAHAYLFEGEMPSPVSKHSLLSADRKIIVEIGLEYLHPSLPTIRDIVVENPSTSTAVTSAQKGDVESDYPDTFAQTFKIQALLNESNQFTVGLKTYLPLNGLSQFDTGNIYQPEFVLYRAESQRPRVLLTSGLDLSPDWRIGIGADVGFSVTAQANVFLQSGNGTVSDQRISAKVKPSIVPQAAVSYQNFNFTVRGENKANFDLSTVAGARVFSNVSAGVDYSYSSQSALFYQPWQLEFASDQAISGKIKLRYGVAYELWSKYEARAAIIRSEVPINCPSGAGNCNSQFSSGKLPEFRARNIFVPQLGLVFDVDQNRLEIDYQFKDSIFRDLPTGSGNYLDPPRHDLKLGFTHPTASGLEWNLHGSLSRLTAQNVVKSDPNEIGGPGYQASGWIYGGGVSVAIPFKN